MKPPFSLLRFLILQSFDNKDNNKDTDVIDRADLLPDTTDGEATTRRGLSHSFRRGRADGVQKMTTTGAYDQLIKLIIIGDTAVGKTSLVVRYCDGGFESKSYLSTVGVDFKTKVVEVDDPEGWTVKVQIWDTAGQERFRNITRAYYRGANGIILVYDVTSRASFENIKSWLADIKENSRGDQPLVLLGNKSDKKRDQVIDAREGEALAKELGVDFFEVSAKIRYNVDEAFLSIVKKGIAYKADSRDPALMDTTNEGSSGLGGCC